MPLWVGVAAVFWQTACRWEICADSVTYILPRFMLCPTWFVRAQNYGPSVTSKSWFRGNFSKFPNFRISECRICNLGFNDTHCIESFGDRCCVVNLRIHQIESPRYRATGNRTGTFWGTQAKKGSSSKFLFLWRSSRHIIMTACLPPNLLALFAPREPIPYLPPVDKTLAEKKRTGYSGVGFLLSYFEVRPFSTKFLIYSGWNQQFIHP
jgi:U1 small nuclear ribonucleoprotein of 70kDa MW N terminal